MSIALAILWSLAGLAWLAWHDPKRRRTFKLPPSDTRIERSVVWVLCLSPGMALLALHSGLGFTIWIGAVSTLGWLMVAVPPAQWVQLAQAVRQKVRRRMP